MADRQLELVRRLQALARTGLHFCANEYDRERYEEIERIAGLMVQRYGIDSIRLTGGEPPIRAHFPVLVGKLAALGVDLAVTTNGATLANQAHDLAEAGLKRIKTRRWVSTHHPFGQEWVKSDPTIPRPP